MRRSAAAALVVALLGGHAGAADEPAPAARPAPPAPTRFLDADGEPARAAFESLVGEIESARGLAFIRRPELVSVAPDAPELAALAEAQRAREPLAAAAPPPPPDALPAVLPDLDRSLVFVSGEPDRFVLGLALARILDAQHHPRLTAAAPRLPGDPGVATRALLGASASLTASRSWPSVAPAHAPTEAELLRHPRLEGRIGGIPQYGPGSSTLVAAIFLLGRHDREEAFRRPPLSTKQLLSPAAYDASDRPRWPAGPAPEVSGCTLRSDESVGVLAMLTALSESGGSVSGSALEAWQGDRLLRFGCRDGAAPWIYVARLARADEAAAFAAALDGLLPADLARPLGTARSERTVAAWSGLPGAAVRDFADGLGESELRDLAQLEP